MAPKSSDAFNSKYQTAINSYKSGDYSGAIDSFKMALDDAPSKGVEAKTRAMIAFNLFLRNQGTDRDQAVQMYKDIIGDVAEAPSTRALVLADLAQITSSQGDAFAKQHFSQAPFDYYVSATEDSPLNVTKTAINMFLASDALYSNSLAEYSIAYNYSILRANKALGTTTPEAAARLMQEHIQRGDKNVSGVSYEPSSIARQYLHRAIGMSSSGRALDNITFEDQESAYKLALSKGGSQEKTDPQVQAVIMQTRFHYASFLFNRASSSRSSDIEQILAPFAQAVGDATSLSSTRDLFLSWGSGSDTSYVKVQSIKLAGVSSDFKRFLLSLGWKL